MKIIVEKKRIIDTLTISNGIAKTNNSLPILSNIFWEAENGFLIIKATDLNCGIISKIKTLKNEGEARFCIGCGILLEYLQTLVANEVGFELEDDKLIIKQGGSRATMPVTKADEYPDFKIENKGNGIEFKKEEFEGILKRTNFAVSKDESRPTLEGIYFKKEKEQLKIVGTDGYRLSVSNLTIDNEIEENLLIPSKYLLYFLKGIGEEKFILGHDKKNNQVFIETKERMMSVRLISGDYPDFNRIIPHGEESQVLIDKAELENMVLQMSVFARQNANIVKMKLGEKLELSTQSGYVGDGKAVGGCKFSGEEGEIAFNYRYLKELLSNLPEGEIRIVFNGNLAPVKFSCDKIENFVHVIMPVKI